MGQMRFGRAARAGLVSMAMLPFFPTAWFGHAWIGRAWFGQAWGQEPKFSLEAVNENIARARNNRLKAVMLADTHGVACGRGVAAVQASGTRVALAIPTFIMDEV